VKDSMEIKNYSVAIGGQWTFEGDNATRRKCLSLGPACGMSSALAIFGYNSSNIGTDQEMLDRINRWDRAQIDSVVPDIGYKAFEVMDVLGGVTRDESGNINGAAVFLWTALMTSKNYDVILMSGGRLRQRNDDAIASTWEAEAVCRSGMTEKHPTEDATCETPQGNLQYAGLFGRSLGDEFGAAISGDVAMIGVSYMLIVVYLFVNLGRRDTVHSMIAVSAATLISIGLSYAGSAGLGSIFGLKQNPLNQNIIFLLLGLGVDDAFVLVAELSRHVEGNQNDSVSELIAKTAKTGGSSILITSVTDALAFLVGSSTTLPALSSFCVFAGLGVMLCFAFQIVFILPVLALNLQRAQDNRFDCLCCFKSKVEHRHDDPRGCCCCLCVPACNPKEGVVRQVLEAGGKLVIEKKGWKAFTLVLWSTIFIAGFIGMTQIRKDFKLEWFFPSDSYVNKFISLNDEYISEGTTFSFYTNELDIFASQAHMNKFTSYVKQQSTVKSSSVNNWWAEFRPVPSNGTAGQTASEFYQEIWMWVQSSNFMNSIRWSDDNCNLEKADRLASCDPTKGIAHTRIAATLKRLGDGGARYAVYNKLRLDLQDIFEDTTGLKAFPFSNDFLYWEENGTIDTELVRNLVVAAGVVFVIIMTLIPQPRIALVVGVGIVMTMVELLGFMHWWGVTINGTSTIYLLICLGLAVDYSAHIAHVFNISEGSMEARSLEALSRIGPSVLHALLSTILAVIALGFSKSYVFVVFFQILFLATTIAGFKGLWLLPVVLSLVGGTKGAVSSIDPSSKAPNVDVELDGAVISQEIEEKAPTLPSPGMSVKDA